MQATTQCGDVIQDTTQSGGVIQATTQSGGVIQATTQSSGVIYTTAQSGGVIQATAQSGGVIQAPAEIGGVRQATAEFGGRVPESKAWSAAYLSSIRQKIHHGRRNIGHRLRATKPAHHDATCSSVTVHNDACIYKVSSVFG